MKKTKNVLLYIMLFCVIHIILVWPIFGCSGKVDLKKQPIIHELEFGGVYVTKTIEEFNELGFEYGDSVTVKFSNGYILEDIPYYNGYYTNNGEPLLVAYPGYDFIKVAINNGDDLFFVANLSEEDTATITINEKGKYLPIQNVRNLQYLDERERYDSDEMFANFRASNVTGLKANTLYRSASPCDNQHNRATFVDALIREAGVSFILDLADTDAKVSGYINNPSFNCPYFLTLYNSDAVYPIGLNMNYGSQDFKEKVAGGLKEMIKHDGPYLVHCTEGKDRTGFVCMLLEALVGASYDEIVKDYMITYYNYYRIGEDSDKYSVIIDSLLNPMIKSMVNDNSVDYKTCDLSVYAEAFLTEAGMSELQISTLKDKLMN